MAAPLISALEKLRENAKITRAIASSIPTIASIVDVKFPFALYCFITATVAAGAVAEASYNFV